MKLGFCVPHPPGRQRHEGDGHERELSNGSIVKRGETQIKVERKDLSFSLVKSLFLGRRRRDHSSSELEL